MNAPRWRRLLWSLTALVVLLLLLKFFVVDVYSIDSGSMRPTLFGGRGRADAEEDTEHVLVAYGRGLEPKRFDLAVIRFQDEVQPLVKRICGLPGDRDLMIRGGDLFIERKRLPPEAPRPAPILVYDDRYLDPERFFEYRRDASVRRDGDTWKVHGDTTSPGSLLHYHPELRDDYLDRHHRRVPGVVVVNDAVLELEFRLEAPLANQRLRFQLIEEGDTFEVVLALAEGAPSSLRLLRRNQRTLQAWPEPGSDAAAARELVLAEERIELAAGQWYDLRFSNIDNHLRVQSSELGVDLGRSYSENEPWYSMDGPWPGPLPAGQRSLGPRLRFGVEAGTAHFRGVRILRDFYYTDDGVFGVSSGSASPPHPSSGPVSLGPEDYFLLGDNSAASTDSRHFGPVKASQLIGKPVAILWPEPRWLHPVDPR